MSQAASKISPKRLGFFTRLLDDTSPQERYRLATEQIAHAEQQGFASAWIAQHHFHRDEGGLPAPLVFLAYVAANTRHIRLGTGVITLAMENALRVAEDASVLDLLSGGRLEIGLGSGGTASSFIPFGLNIDTRGEAFGKNLDILRHAWAGKALEGEDNQLYPPAQQLNRRLWQATFSPEGGARAGAAGDGLMLSRTQPRPEDQQGLPLDVLQNRIIDAYLEALPAGVEPRILGSRTAFVSDDADEARRLAAKGLQRQADGARAAGNRFSGNTLDEHIAAFDVHLGTADQVIASLQRDTALARVTDLAFQVHSIDPPHPYILRSIELIAKKVAPALGWVRRTPKNIAKPQPLHQELSRETL